jgi:hypothetical protein
LVFAGGAGGGGGSVTPLEDVASVTDKGLLTRRFESRMNGNSLEAFPFGRGSTSLALRVVAVVRLDN